jgi:hypothetical protein
MRWAVLVVLFGIALIVLCATAARGRSGAGAGTEPLHREAVGLLTQRRHHDHRRLEVFPFSYECV